MFLRFIPFPERGATGLDADAAWARVARPTAAGARQPANADVEAAATVKDIGGGGVSLK